jgi:hypothetical protein
MDKVEKTYSVQARDGKKKYLGFQTINEYRWTKKQRIIRKLVLK